MTSADERLLCRCPSKCTQRATQEDGLCDTCRPTGLLGIDPSQFGESVIVRARAGCLHFGPIDTLPGTPTTPAGVTFSSWVADS